MGLDEGFLELARQLVGDDKARLRCETCKRDHGVGLGAIADALREGWPVCCDAPVPMRVSAKRAASLAGQQLSARGASKGGAARAASLSPARRREIAKKAIAARWRKP